MRNSKTSNKLNIMRAAAIVTALAAAGWGYGCAWHTFVIWWEPVLWAAAAGAASAHLLYRGAETLMRGARRGIVLVAAGLWAAAVFYGCALGINYSFADGRSATPEEAVITGKHSEERTRYRRVGRGRNIPSGKYTVYYLTVRFANGCEREMPVSAGRYAEARDGMTEHFVIEKGLLGFPVFKSGKADGDEGD